MNANDVRALVALRYPNALQSPLARAVAAASDDAANQANDAIQQALSCLRSRDGWCVETLSHNISSNCPDLSDDECDDIARAAIAQFRP